VPNLTLLCEVLLILSPLGILLLLAGPKIRLTIGPASARGRLLATVFLFLIMIAAGIGEFMTEQRFHIYNAVMMLAIAGIVAARVIRYFKAGHGT
jgi:hypothetical protein